jgi:hypothetical protein
MKMNLKNQQNLIQRLRYIAEQHPDDIFANTASSLAYRMEAIKISQHDAQLQVYEALHRLIYEGIVDADHVVRCFATYLSEDNELRDAE